jgi:reverse transcriptase-like protein
VELFRKYIRNKRTVVLTDCSALQWLKTRDEGARVMRWVVRLGEFDLDIQHRKGRKSSDVDGLTRELPFIPKTHGEEVEPLYDTTGGLRIEGTTAVVTRSGKGASEAESSTPKHDEEDGLDHKHTEDDTSTSKGVEGRSPEAPPDRTCHPVERRGPEACLPRSDMRAKGRSPEAPSDRGCPPMERVAKGRRKEPESEKVESKARQRTQP